ncbi:MAG: hypothetical protein ABFS41_17795 [Myxococcota bacterium]
MQFERVGPGETKVSSDGDAADLVFVDGRLDAAAFDPGDLPAGVRISTLTSVLEEEPELVTGYLGRLAEPKRHALVALQTAFLEEGSVVVIEPGTKAEKALRFRFLSSSDGDAASACFPRLIVVAGENSETMLMPS